MSVVNLKKKREKEIETEDIYNEEEREEMLEEDEITAAENAFMAGREMMIKKKKERWREHKESTAVELAEEEYVED